MKRLIAGLIDTIIVFGVGALILMLTILVLKMVGFIFLEGVMPWAYVISTGVVSLLYYPIVESTKLNTTLGKKIFKL